MTQPSRGPSRMTAPVDSASFHRLSPHPSELAKALLRASLSPPTAGVRSRETPEHKQNKGRGRPTPRARGARRA